MPRQLDALNVTDHGGSDARELIVKDDVIYAGRSPSTRFGWSPVGSHGSRARRSNPKTTRSATSLYVWREGHLYAMGIAPFTLAAHRIEGAPSALQTFRYGSRVARRA